MKIAFTICSNNYIAQAKTLGDSIKKTNPDYHFFIGLTDTLSSEIDYQKEIGHTIIPVEEIGIPEFDNLWKNYSIIEFNTNVKPFYFQYFINHYPGLGYLYYLDPDTFVYQDFSIIEHEFGENGTTLLTPHILTPIEIDDKQPGENLFLNFGIYNLGFLGMKNPQPDNKLIKWWKERTYHLGYNQPSKGLFVDQLWHNLTPIFFENIIISKHPGLNMGPWNLHERRLSETNHVYLVNSEFPLSFYHFSNYNYTNSNAITKHYTRYNFDTNSDLKNIYLSYHELLIVNGIEKLGKIKCHYMEMREQFLNNEYLKKIKSSRKEMLKHHLKKLLSTKVVQIINIIRN